MLVLMLVGSEAYPCLAKSVSLYKPRLALLRQSSLLSQLAADYASTVKARCVSTNTESPTRTRGVSPDTSIQSIYEAVIRLRYGSEISTEG